jgi:predicted negative regulator of RcsB-dependent stress response
MTVDEFLTDDEQAERTKGWLRANSVFIVAGVFIGLGALFGWQQWEDHTLKQSGDASVIWEQLSDAIQGQRFNEVQETIGMLETDYADTPYLDQARLAVARMYMDRNEPEQAIEQLELLARTSGDKQVQRVAELRQAQVLLHLQRYDEALTSLGDADNTAFVGQFYNLRGDVYFAQGRLEDARMQYLAALAATATGAIDRSFVQMKLDDVSATLANAAPVTELQPVEVDSAEPPSADDDVATDADADLDVTADSAVSQ